MSADPFELFTDIAGLPLSVWPSRFPDRRGLGVFGAYVPEELIIAAGCVPVHLGGSESSPADQAYLPRFACAPGRNLLARGLAGELDWLEGLAFGTGCDAGQALGDLWSQLVSKPRAFMIKAPVALNSPAAPAYLKEELRRFARALGVDGEQGLREAVQLTNTTRALLARFAGTSGDLTPRRVHAVLSAALRMPRDEFNNTLARLLDSSGAAAPRSGPRLIVAGPHLAEAGLYEAIELAGGVVAGDMLELGGPYFDGLIPAEGDPLEAIACHMLRRLPTPAKFGELTARADNLIARVRRSAARGVILADQPFCDPHGFDAPALRQALSRENIPCLNVEAGAEARIHTRVEAFLEMLRR